MISLDLEENDVLSSQLQDAHRQARRSVCLPGNPGFLVRLLEILEFGFP